MSESIEDDKKKDEMKIQKKKKAEDKKHSKWLSIGYHSLAVDDPTDTTLRSYASTDDDGDGTNIHFVIGDCTQPSTNSDEAYIILSYAPKPLCLPQIFYWVHSQCFQTEANKLEALRTLVTDCIASTYPSAHCHA